ncbi:MAG: glycosyltransferase family 4 protein [Clostridiales bacterium]|nr:glycosyltransferase family 4 protein [Clostridiales bacterium]
MIAYNLQPIAVRGLTGIGNYTAQVARRLIDKDSELHAFDFLGRNGAWGILEENLQMDLSGNDLHIVRSLPLSVYIRMGSAGKVIPYKTLTHSGADLTVFFNYLTPGGLTGKNIITIYDLVSERFPETMQARNRRLLQGHLKDSASRASAVLTISEFSKREIIDVLGVPEEKIFVGYCGVDTEYYTPGKGFTTGIDKKFGLESYILYVGTLEPRKNIKTLVEAYGLIADKFPDIKLVLAGGLGWQPGETLSAIENSPYSDRIVRCGYVSNEEKRDLLRNARVFCFPSIYEGFGMPVTEAMACGTDCIVSDSSSLTEIAGDLLYKIDPGDVDGWAQALQAKLSSPMSEDRAKALRAKAETYTWEQAAAAAHNAIEFANYGIIK